MKSILIADDEPHVTRVLRLVLENEGYQVVCTDNGQDALELFGQLQPDVLIADIKMPRLSGKELVNRVRNSKTGRAIPVIVMTSSLESEYRDWLVELPNIRFVGKPVSPRELVTIINGFFDDPASNVSRVASF